MAAEMRGRHRPWANSEGMAVSGEANGLSVGQNLMDSHSSFDVGQQHEPAGGMSAYQYPIMSQQAYIDPSMRRPGNPFGFGAPTQRMHPSSWNDNVESSNVPQPEMIPSFRQNPFNVQGEGQYEMMEQRQHGGDMHEPLRKMQVNQMFDFHAKMAKLESPITAPSQPMNDALESIVADKDVSGNAINYSCNRCGMVFPKKKFLMSHVRSNHAVTSPFSCEVCTMGFAEKEQLTRHLRSRHRDRRLYECDLCSATPFVNSINLEKHKQMVHEDRRPYPCVRCEFAFTTKNNLEKHVRTVHDKIRPFRCEHCSSAFDTRNNLQKHTKTVHDKLRPHTCTRCDTSFGQKSHLDRHVRTVHDNYRPFNCHLCSSCFGRKSHLNVHIRTVHENVRPYACDVCGATFGEKGTLTTHIRRIHKKDAVRSM
mmetsp:Transcript_177/g.563  ORF Transcript_177/g.563 Transcript_177/m.563 type:complete len:423 (+) Transcript_177:471-1739(+)